MTRTGRTARPHGRRLTLVTNGLGPQRDLATLQSTGPLANLGGRWVRCKGHTPTYSLYTASGHQPRVYTACHDFDQNADWLPVRLTRPAPKIFSFLSDYRKNIPVEEFRRLAVGPHEISSNYMQL